jgi:hypothetical protein
MRCERRRQAADDNRVAGPVLPRYHKSARGAFAVRHELN